MDHRPGGIARAAIFASIGVLAAVPPAAAQCPDGTPPPCATPGAPAPAPNSLAVLYFDVLSRDTTDVFLADGLTDELLTRLGQVARLRVQSRFASERVRGRRDLDPRALGRTLGAAYLVTGSLQHMGPRVLVNVALVRAATGRQVWGDVYTRTGDWFAVEADIASTVAGAIAGRLLPGERATLARVPTRDPLAYDLYLRGVGAARTSDEPGLRAALAYFDQAIARDSGFARAYVEKAEVWESLADGYVEGRVGYSRAREAAAEALRRDSSLAEAYAVLGDAAVALDADVPRGRALAERALALDPASSAAHDVLAGAWMLSPDSADAALLEARRAWEVDTLAFLAAFQYVWVLAVQARAETLLAVLPRMAAVLAPDDIRELEGVVRLLRGDPAGAAERLSWSYYGGGFAGEYVRARLALGQRDAARAAADSMADRARHGYFNPMAVARALADLGDVDSAFAWLDRAWEQRTSWMAALRAYPDLAPLRADPRWAALLRRMGLEP